MNPSPTYSLNDIRSNRAQHCHSVESLLLRKVAVQGHEVVEKAIGRDKSAVSRIFSGDRGIAIYELGPLLDALGLSIVETSGKTITIDTERYEALRVLARTGI